MMNRLNGKRLTVIEHIRQSINDILSTPLRTRVMRRTYGSILPDLVDMPMNGPTRLLMCAATAGAIARFEKRIRLTRVAISAGGSDGRQSIDMTGVRLDLPNNPPFAHSLAL